MNIGFVYEPFDAAAGSYGAHGYFLATELIRRGHELWGPGLPAMPGMVSLPSNKWGKLRMLRHADLLYIRVGVLNWLERCTWLRLLRPTCPVVWEVNGSSEELLGSDSPGPDALYRYRRDVRRKRWMGHLVDTAFCVGDSLTEHVRRSYGIRQCISVPNGGDPGSWMPDGGNTCLATMNDRFKVFWAGDASLPWQGLAQIVEAARRCERIAPDVLFVMMIGGRPMRHDLPHLRNTLYLRGCDRITTCRYLADSDCALAIYPPCGWRAVPTGYPLKAMETMAACKPLIFDGFCDEFLRDEVEGLKVTPDADALVQAVLRLRNDSALCDRLAASARSRLESEYTWKHVVDRIEPRLLELVEKRVRGAATPVKHAIAGECCG